LPRRDRDLLDSLVFCKQPGAPLRRTCTPTTASAFTCWASWARRSSACARAMFHAAVSTSSTHTTSVCHR
jgi:hypothetical protein